MASGTIYLNKSSSTSGGSWLEGRIVWSSTSNKSANTSDVTLTLQIRKNANITLTQGTGGTWKYSLLIDGKYGISNDSIYKTGVLTSWVTIATKTIFGFVHHSDGKRSIEISGSCSGPSGTSLSGKTTSGSKTVSLDTIPRASSITSAANVTIGNYCSVKWTPKSSSFTYKLKFSCGEVTHTVGDIDPITPNKTSEHTYSGYKFDLNKWAAAMPKSYSAKCTVTLYTYSGTTQIGSASSSFTLYLPSSVKPTISNFSATPQDAYNGFYVQGKSKCKLSATLASGTGSSVKSWSITGCGISKSGSAATLSETTDILYSAGKQIYTVKVTDGRTSVSQTKEIDVYPYAAPTIKINNVQRAGTNAIITYTATYSSINGNNRLGDLKVYRKLTNNYSWGEPVVTLENAATSGEIQVGDCASDQSYDFKVTIADTAYGSIGTSLVATISTDFRLINVDIVDNKIAFGKLAEIPGLFDCNLQVALSNTQPTIVSGSIWPHSERDGELNLGNSRFRWNQLYATNTTISTSDRNAKEDIKTMSDLQERLFDKLKPVTFKFKDGTSGRTHYGYISQDVENAMSELGMSGTDFAGFCKDEKVDEDGNVVLDENGNAIHVYSLRYSEFIALNTYMIQKLKIENAQLDEKNIQLENNVQELMNKVEALYSKVQALEDQSQDTSTICEDVDLTIIDSEDILTEQ